MKLTIMQNFKRKSKSQNGAAIMFSSLMVSGIGLAVNAYRKAADEENGRVLLTTGMTRNRQTQ